ncbi:MAG TPA: hypothetical protein DEP69_03555 [Acidimicrobiaceae bacterium]|nr:hypothetical protein [Acidimicrobiaceae bacterium]
MGRRSAAPRVSQGSRAAPARPAQRAAGVVAAALLVGLAAAACSGGSTSVADTTTTVSPTTTTAPPPPTTRAAPVTTVPPTTTTTTTEPPPLAPLTGLVAAAEITRPAVVVKIDNHRNATPQWGLNQADVVFEEIVEGGITRFAAVFHSNDLATIGPIRSARTGDFDLLRNLNKPIFVNSGANEIVWRLLRREDAIVVSDANISAVFSRSPDKHAPHNLVTSTALVYAARPGEGGTPPALFRYHEPGRPLANSSRASGVDIDFGTLDVSYRWDAPLGGYARTHYGRPHNDFAGERIAPANLIVQLVRYGQSAGDRYTPEPRLIGSGDALVFSGGRMVEADWRRASSTAVTEYRDAADGRIVLLEPGPTWVALTRVGTAVVVE